MESGEGGERGEINKEKIDINSLPSYGDLMPEYSSLRSKEDLNAAEVTRLKKLNGQRLRLISEWKKTDLYRKLKGQVNTLQDIYKGDFDEAIKIVATVNPERMEEDYEDEVGLDLKLKGIAKDWYDGAKLQMQIARENSRDDSDPDKIQKWEREYSAIGWGTPRPDLQKLAKKKGEQEETEELLKTLRETRDVEAGSLPITDLTTEGEVPPRVTSPEESEVFGTTDAFSERWTRLHGIPDRIGPFAIYGIKKPFSPAKLLSEISETGLSTRDQEERASLVVREIRNENFKIAYQTGFLPIISLDHAMKSSRIDSTAETLKHGPTPQGVAQWLLADDETRRCLALLFKLEGYPVKDEIDPTIGAPFADRMLGLDRTNTLARRGAHSFRDVIKITPDEIKEYLEIVQQAVGTDKGVARLAYTIFRALGFAHGNKRFAGDTGLWGKYWVGAGGDLATEDIAPFVNKFKDPSLDKKLFEIIRDSGIKGLALSLNRLPAELLAREWADMQLIVSAMDSISDIRSGVGGAFDVSPEKRLSAIKSQVEELGTVSAKRKLSQETFERLIDPKRILKIPEAGKTSTWEDYKNAMSAPLSFLRHKQPVAGKKEK